MRAAAWLVAVLGLALALAASAQEPTTPDLPAGDASITGTVLHRGSGAPVPGFVDRWFPRS